MEKAHILYQELKGLDKCRGLVNRLKGTQVITEKRGRKSLKKDYKESDNDNVRSFSLIKNYI